MTLFDSLSENEKYNMLFGYTVGFFNTLVLENDAFYSKKHDLCLGYYMYRSGNKKISPTYEKLIYMKYIQEDRCVEIVDDNDTNVVNMSGVNISVKDLRRFSVDDLMGVIIRGKFIDKWTSVYKTLIEEQYSVLEEKVSKVKRDGDNHNNDIYDITVQSDSKTNTDYTVTNKGDNKSHIAGFNSPDLVETDKQDSDYTEHRTGLKDDNTSENIETKTGTLNNNNIIDETININGRNQAPAELIAKELDLRNKNIFFDIVYKDIDSIATIQVY